MLNSGASGGTNSPSSSSSPTQTVSYSSFDETWAPTVELPGGSESEVPGDRWDQAVRAQFEELVEEAAALDTDDDPVVLFQLPIISRIGVWDVTSLADLVTLEPTDEGVRSRVLEVKTAWKDKTAHQVQALARS